MATTKKTTASAEEPKKLKSGSASSGSTSKAVTKSASSKSASTAGQTQKTTSRQAVILDDKTNSKLHLFMPFILIVSAIFIAGCLICTRIPGSFGDFGRLICSVLFGLFGWPAFFIPLIILNLAIYWKQYVERDMVGFKIFLSFMALAFIGALVHVFSVGSEYDWNAWGSSLFGSNGAMSNWKLGQELIGGGFAGGFVGGFFRCLTGPVGSPILLIALIAATLMFMFGVTPGTVWSSIKYRFEEIRVRTQEANEAKKQKEYERQKELRRRERENEKKRREREAKQAEMAKKDAEEAAARQKRLDEEARKAEAARKKKEAADAAARPTASPSDPAGTNASSGRPAPSLDDIIFMPASSGDLTGTPAPAAPTEKSVPLAPAAPASPDETAQGTSDPGSLLASIFDDAAFSDGRQVTRKKAPAREVALGADPADPAAPAEPARKKNPPARPTDKEGKNDIPLTEIVLEGDGILTGGSAEAEPDPAQIPPEEVLEPYVFPFPELLHEIVAPGETDINSELQTNAQKLMNKLHAFNVKIQKIEYSRGPTITRYELYPEASTRVRSIANLSDDIALELAAMVRIEAPIPNKQAVGIEVPNKVRATVFMRELIESEKFCNMKSKLSACLGKDVGGNMVFIDIAKTPHLLIAGTTGSGKSVCINCIILSLLYKSRPDEVQFIMIDPKKIEMGMYNDLPHMKVPVVTDVQKAAGALNAAVNEMEHRYELFEEVHARDIDSYNRMMASEPDFKPLPKIVIIIDELADLMMTGPAEVEASIARLAQKARAAGLHLIIGTQRPSVNVITGVIKANIPTRIAFMVASQTDSRVIIDQQGAEKLIGKGDMLYAASDNPKPVRVQGAFVADDEVEAVTNFIKERNAEHGEYDNEFMEEIEREAERLGEKKGGSSDDDDGAYMFSQPADELFSKALTFAVENGTVATSFLQRKLSIGFGRAGKIIDRMEALGFVSPANGTKPRNVLLTAQQLAEMKMNGDSRVDGNFND